MASWIERVEGGVRVVRNDDLAVEEPLEIQLGFLRSGWRVHKSVAVTMRTPGYDEELAVGFLFGEGVIGRTEDVVEVKAMAANTVRVELTDDVVVEIGALERNFYTTSSCGVCGKASIAALRVGHRREVETGGPFFKEAVIYGLAAALRERQKVFLRTGGLHAAAAFDASGTMLGEREDVGRHNAVDKLVGWKVLSGGRRELAESLLFVSGRASFELVQKAMVAGIPMMAAVGAPSSLAVELARESGMTLVGFVRENRFNIYTHPERIV